MNNEDKHELTELVKHAVREEMEDVFSGLGVDLRNQQSKNSFRSDLVWANQSRRASEAMKNKFFMTIVALISGAGFVAAWEAIKHGLK